MGKPCPERHGRSLQPRQFAGLADIDRTEQLFSLAADETERVAVATVEGEILSSCERQAGLLYPKMDRSPGRRGLVWLKQPSQYC